MRGFLVALVASLLLPAAAQAAPTARLTVSPAPSYQGEAVTLDGSSSTCDVAPCVYRFRDLGPNGTASPNWPLSNGYIATSTFTFAFQNAGTKYLQLTVRNAAGQSSSARVNQTVLSGQRPTDPPPPPTDTDGDGVADDVDQCDTEPGPASNNGCPVVDPPPPPPPSGDWPNLTNTGARGELTDRSTSLTASATGQVIENLRFTNGASIQVNANNVVIRNVRMEGGTITWSGNRNVLIEDTTVTSRPGTTRTQDREGVIGYGGGTLRRVQITNRAEGVRDGDSSPLTIEDSFIYVNAPPTCGDWHGDALQGYGSGGNQPLTVRNTYFELDEGGCGGTAPFFYPGRDNTGPVIADRVIVKGGGFSFRMSTPGSVTNLHIVNNEWGFGPLSVKCSVVSPWSAWRSTLDANYQPTPVSEQPCNTEAPPGT